MEGGFIRTSDEHSIEPKVRFRGQQLTVKTARCNHDGNLMRALQSDARS